MQRTVITCDICGKEIDEHTDQYYHCESSYNLYAGNDPLFKNYDICMDCWKSLIEVVKYGGVCNRKE